MAEVFGIVAGAAGLVTLFVELKKGVKTIQDARKHFEDAPDDLEEMAAELEFLTDLVEILVPREASISQVYPQGAAILRHCEGSCKRVVGMLEVLRAKYFRISSLKGHRKSLRKFSFRGWEEDVGRFRNRVESAKQNLTLVGGLEIRSNVYRLLALDQSRPLTNTNEAAASDETLPAQESFHKQVLVEDTSTALQMSTTSSLPRRRRSRDCSVRPCSCSCHRRQHKGSCYWWIDFTSWKELSSTCDNSLCTGSTYEVTFRLALSQIGVSWATVLHFQAFAGTRSFFLRPALWIERTVPYSSPGFRILNGVDVITDPKYVKSQLLDLYRADPTFTSHVDPAGNSYLEYFIRSCWYYHVTIANRLELLDILQFLVEDIGLLSHSNPAGEAQFPNGFGLIQNLIDAGLDPMEVEATKTIYHYEKSLSVDTEFYRPGLLPLRRPLNVASWKLLCDISSGGESVPETDLHEAIMRQPDCLALDKLISESSRDSKNSLGQTPLHVAAMYAPRSMKSLVRAGHSLEVSDNAGITPIRWAVGLFNDNFDAEALAAAVEAAAELGTSDALAISEMWALLVKRASVGLRIKEFLTGIRSLREAGFHAVAYWQCVYALKESMKNDEEIMDGSSKFEAEISRLLGIVSSENTSTQTQTLSKNNRQERHTSWLVASEIDYRATRLDSTSIIIEGITLASHITVLAKQGFELVGYVNSRGGNAFWEIKCERKGTDGAIEAMLNCGVDPKRQDYRGHTPLHLFSLELTTTNDRYQAEAIIRVLSKFLEKGGCPLLQDRCKCSCAPHGCLALPSQIALPENHLPLDAMLALIRRTKHWQLGLTHVCCVRGSSTFLRDSLDPDDAHSILEEEEELIHMLDADMKIIEEKSFEDLLQLWLQTMTATQSTLQAEAEEEAEPLWLLIPGKQNETALSQTTKSFLAQQICYQDYYLNYSRRSIENPELEEEWYSLHRSRVFRLIGVLGIPDKFVQDIYWNILSRKHWVKLSYGSIFFCPPKDVTWNEKLVEHFMMGSIHLENA